MLQNDSLLESVSEELLESTAASSADETSQLAGAPRTARRMGGQGSAQAPAFRRTLPQAENPLRQLNFSMPELPDIPDDVEIPAVGGRRSVGLFGLVAAAGLVGGVVGRSLGGAESGSGQPELAYTDPVIRKGSVLMSHPGPTFAFRQQYFHKAVILITRQTNIDVGLILNRPSSLLTTQLGIPGPPWQVMFGGDVQGIKSFQGFDGSTGVLELLHTMEKFKGDSREVIRGVYLMDFEKGQELVSRGQARTTDFFLVAGYCGWSPGQLQGELKGGFWKMATVDSRIIIRELQEEAMEMQALSQVGLDDGIALWRHIYAKVDSGFPRAAQPNLGPTDKLADLALQQWVEENLTPNALDFFIPSWE